MDGLLFALDARLQWTPAADQGRARDLARHQPGEQRQRYLFDASPNGLILVGGWPPTSGRPIRQIWYRCSATVPTNCRDVG